MFPNLVKNIFHRLKVSDYRTIFPCAICLRKQKSTFSPFHVDLIQRFTDRSKEDVLRVLEKCYYDIIKLPPGEVEARLDHLKNLNLANNDKLRLIPLLGLHRITITNRYQALREYGFCPDKISASTLIRFVYFCEFSVAKLKKLSYIEKDTDVVGRLSSAADVEVASQLAVNDTSSLISVKVAILIEFLKKNLDMKDEAFNEVETKTPIKRMKNKSFQIIRRNLEIATEIIGMSKERVRNNMFVLAADPDNSLEMMRRFRELGGVDIRVCVRTHPKILAMTVDNMDQITRHLQEFGVSEGAVRRYIQTYTLNSDTVRRRLEQLDLVDPHRVFRNHPKLLGLVYYQNKIQRRLRLLQEMDINHISLHAITSAQQIFERLTDGRDPSGNDSLYLVTAELGMDKTELRQKLKRRPYWHLVPLVEIVNNLTLLRQTFSKQEIIQHVYILFYPSDAVRRELEDLERKEGIDCCRSKPGHGAAGPGPVSRELILPALLYYLEKQTDFAGHSVWDIPANPDQQAVYQDLPEPKKITSITDYY